MKRERDDEDQSILPNKHKVQTNCSISGDEGHQVLVCFYLFIYLIFTYFFI